MTGRLIAGRYAIRDLLGRGASGTVVEALDTRLKRLVALKLIPRAHDSDPMAQELMHRAWQEARSAGRLSHPGIVTVFDAGEGPDYVWIAMELVIGETLMARLQRPEPVPLADALRWMGELLSALAAAHRIGIVHRDVKPANIMLAEGLDHAPGRLMLTDFGIAQLSGSDLTLVGQVVGTPSWMSPEQVRGETAEQRCDLWGAACVFYMMLTGRRPYLGRDLALILTILQDMPPAPSTLREGLPPALDRVFARAFTKRRADRYADAAAMASAIEAACNAAVIYGEAAPPGKADSVAQECMASPPSIG